MTIKDPTPTFCILPWIHSSITPEGDVYPCCHSLHLLSKKTQNLKDSSLGEIQGGEFFTNLRNQMLKGEQAKSCEFCYLTERAGGKSLRMESNEDFKDHINLAVESGPDNFLKMIYLDIRASNICNLKCRTCNPESSSSLVDEFAEIFSNSNPKILRPTYSGWNEVISKIKDDTHSLERIYFAGGEPLLHIEQYEILELLIEKKHTSLQLDYNTNCTTLRFQNKNILKLWNHFPHVSVWASVDAIGKKAEYIRKGSQWPLIEKNIKSILLMTPHVSIILSPTISILNVYHLTEMFDYFLEKKLVLNASYIRFNILQRPFHYHIGIIPLNEKTSLCESWKTYIKKHEDKKTAGIQSLKKEFETLINFFLESDLESYQSEFREVTSKVDTYRKEKMSDILPELNFVLSPV